MKSFSNLRSTVSRITGNLAGSDLASGSAAGMDAVALACMLDSIPINVIYADRDGIIRYMNKSSTELFEQLEHLMPVKANELLGNTYDIFHKNPERIRRLLADPSNLPHKAIITFGNEKLSLHATAVYDDHSNYVGVMQTWSKVTDQVFLEKSQQKLRESLTDAMVKVSDVTGRLTSITATVDNGVKQTAEQAASASDSARIVSGNAQSVAAATEEMTASIREIARSAAEAARVAAHAVSVAESANSRIATLGDSSSQIGNVIRVINSIAQQTKLLALNATIEAARAGEAGKGFAVVANEVKELAKETADATEDINKKIEAIQNDTNSAVATINEISSIIRQINDIQVTIASAVEEQTATTNEINRSISDIASGSGGIAHNAEVVAKDAEMAAKGIADAVHEISHLNNMATSLSQLMAELDQGFIKSEEIKRH